MRYHREAGVARTDGGIVVATSREVPRVRRNGFSIQKRRWAPARVNLGKIFRPNTPHSLLQVSSKSPEDWANAKAPWGQGKTRQEEEEVEQEGERIGECADFEEERRDMRNPRAARTPSCRLLLFLGVIYLGLPAPWRSP